MLQHIKINDTQYPLLFSLRAVFGFMNTQQLKSLEEVEDRIAVDLDALLELYEQAMKKGAKKDDDFDGEPLTAEEIEDAMDEDPELFMEFQELFNNSRVIQTFNEKDEESSDKKK